MYKSFGWPRRSGRGVLRQYWAARPLVVPGLKLTLKRLINLLGVESHDDRTINDNHRSGHITEFLEIGQGAGVLCYVPLLKLYAFLRKILFRLVAEHSPMLGINDDVLRHSAPPAGFVPLASKRWMDSFAPLITSRTGWSEKTGFGGASCHTDPGVYTAV
jgi:hypothetical protein